MHSVQLDLEILIGSTCLMKIKATFGMHAAVKCSLACASESELVSLLFADRIVTR